MKNKKDLITIAVIVALIAILTCVNIYLKHTTFNADGVNGNTTGNLNNKGLFCEYNGKVYFSNPYDYNHLYVMNSDGTEPRLIKDDSVQSINVYGKYIYYTKTGSDDKGDFAFLNINRNCLCRTNLNGKHKIILDSEPSMSAALSGNYIYYLHYEKETATTLFKVRIDGKEKASVSDVPYNTAGSTGNYIYYDEHDDIPVVTEYNTLNGSTSDFYNGNCYDCTLSNNYLYFMDCKNNFSLSRVYLPTGKKETLVKERIDKYNLYDDYIYYQTNNGDKSALCRIHADGTGMENISTGVFTDINITSQYVYFRKFATETPIYKTPTTGEIDVTNFEVVENEK